jgi:hypothetical protein
MDNNSISLVVLVKEQFCPVCKEKIKLSKIFLVQFKSEFQCDNCHSHLRFSTSRLFMILIIGASVFFPFDTKYHIAFVLLIALFYFPIISIWLGFEESDLKSHKHDK